MLYLDLYEDCFGRRLGSLYSVKQKLSLHLLFLTSNLRHKQINNHSLSRCFILSCSDYLFKLLLIGDSGVGKSCLLLRFAVSSYLLGETSN